MKFDTREKLAAAVARFCAENQMNKPFIVSGGAIMNLIHAFADRSDCQYIPMHHEQSAAMAADSLSRSSSSPGLAIATSGPGATNLITGIAGAFYDSIPVFFITGQVSTTRMVGATNTRQIGFQETPIVSMVKDITKYSVQINKSTEIRFELEKAYWIMLEGRPGPVLVDIPDNLQREIIEWSSLKKFTPELKKTQNELTSQCSIITELLEASERPVIIGGWGIHLSKAESEFQEFVEKLKIPTVLTWAAADLISKPSPYRIGTFGTHGTRRGNFAVQNADLIISIGSRLDTKATGSPVSTFARGAKKVIIDIDSFELKKFEQFGLVMDFKIQVDAKTFLKEFLSEHKNSTYYPGWLEDINLWGLSTCEIDNNHRDLPGINPYELMRELFYLSPNQLNIFLDTGCLLPWLLQEYEPKTNHRLFHDFNNTAMGWAIPALAGGLVGNPTRNSICVVGDGSFMMSMQELSVLSSFVTPAKIVLIDNSGYSMIRQTQDQWLGSEYYASSLDGGLHFPNFKKIAEAFNFNYMEISEENNVTTILQSFWESDGPIFLRIVISPNARVIPQVKFGRPNEDMEPLIPREIFYKHMIISPLDAPTRSENE